MNRSVFRPSPTTVWTFLCRFPGFLRAGGLGDDLLSDRLRYFRVRIELHGVRRSPLSARTQVSSVAEHVGKRHKRFNYLGITLRFHAFDTTTARREVANHVTHVVL